MTLYHSSPAVLTPGPVEPLATRAAKLWKVIGGKFDVSEGRITHPGLEIERAKQAERRADAKRYADKRWGNLPGERACDGNATAFRSEKQAALH